MRHTHIYQHWRLPLNDFTTAILAYPDTFGIVRSTYIHVPNRWTKRLYRKN